MGFVCLNDACTLKVFTIREEIEVFFKSFFGVFEKYYAAILLVYFLALLAVFILSMMRNMNRVIKKGGALQ